jgi:tetratricopeptide (TPR) repeat protein
MERALVRLSIDPEQDLSSVSHLAPSGLGLVLSAEAYRLSGMFVEAAKMYREASRSNPNDPVAKAGYIHLTRTGAARIDGLLHITPEAPWFKRAHLYLGIAYRASKRLDLAAAELRSYTEAVPEDPAGWLELGRTLALTRGRRGAVDCVERALRRAPASLLWHRRAVGMLVSARAFGKAFALARQTSRRFDQRARWYPFAFPVFVESRLIPLAVAGVALPIAVGGWVLLETSSGLLLPMLAALASVTITGWSLWAASVTGAISRGREARTYRRMLRAWANA